MGQRENPAEYKRTAQQPDEPRIAEKVQPKDAHNFQFVTKWDDVIRIDEKGEPIVFISRSKRPLDEILRIWLHEEGTDDKTRQTISLALIKLDQKKNNHTPIK